MSIFEDITTKEGIKGPLGPLKTLKGYNFALYSESKNATLILLNNNETIKIPLHKRDNIFHVEILNLPKNTLYAYIVDGTLREDPYAKSFASPTIWGQAPNKDTYIFAKVEIENLENNFDSENIKKPNIKSDDLIIYEMHVRGFTNDKSSNVKHPGSFLAILEKIDYLKELGVNAIELMPIYEFDETSYNKINPTNSQRLFNYWGYSPISFFSIMKRYGTDRDFKTLIKELHKNGIEVILDVVYNHMQNPIKDKNYFLLDDKNYFLNFSGCGNTVNCNSEIGAKLILDSLVYFVDEFKVDGFRFDLASILTRSDGDKILEKPKILELIKNEKKLKNVKLIAEPWDAAGLHQLGFFEKYNFFEWNDQFRNVLRKFIRGDKNLENEFLDAMLGKNSAIKNPINSINYVTCHDGFSLYDLLSYEQKQNLANGEENKDGSIWNFSSNSGHEGLTSTKNIQDLRVRQAKNFLLALMISNGIPMLLMGDEYLHTKKGNNNTWCQDNALSYFLWDKKKVMFDFLKTLIKFRKENKDFLNLKNLCFENNSSKKRDITKSPNNTFIDIKDNFLKIQTDNFIYMFNSSKKDITVELDLKKYQILIDTFDDNKSSFENTITLKSFSSMILEKQN